jgi:hypothetical protein
MIEFDAVFRWTADHGNAIITVRKRIVSSTCRVTGVSSPNLARSAFRRAGHFFITRPLTGCHAVSFFLAQHFIVLLRAGMLRRTNNITETVSALPPAPRSGTDFRLTANALGSAAP